MKLFDSNVAPLSGHANASLGHFEYLNRSDRTEAYKIRKHFEEMFERYPVRHRARLAGQFRSKNRISHFSAAFELSLHELALRNGAEVVAIDEPVANGRAPDYLIQTSDGARLFIEAACAVGASEDEAGGKQRLDEAIAVVDAEVSGDFFWNIETRGIPSQPVKLSLLRKQLRAWSSLLNYEAVVQGRQENLRFEAQGCEIVITPQPRNDRSKPATRGLGARFGDVHWGLPQHAVREKMIEKANRYGDLDHPLVVAINALEPSFDDDDIVDALFGDLIAIVSRDTDAVREDRDTNGVWWGPEGPRNDRMAAAIVVSSMSPWALGSRRASLIRNPYKSDVGFAIPIGAREAFTEGGLIKWRSGPTFGEQMGLAPD